MLVLTAWGVWKTRSNPSEPVISNGTAVCQHLALLDLLEGVFCGAIHMPNLAFNTTIHVFEWVGSVDCGWGSELQTDP